VEVKIPVNSHVNVIPGSPPSEPQPGIVPEPISPEPAPAEIVGLVLSTPQTTFQLFPEIKYPLLISYLTPEVCPYREYR